LKHRCIFAFLGVNSKYVNKNTDNDCKILILNSLPWNVSMKDIEKYIYSTKYFELIESKHIKSQRKNEFITKPIFVDKCEIIIDEDGYCIGKAIIKFFKKEDTLQMFNELTDKNINVSYHRGNNTDSISHIKSALLLQYAKHNYNLMEHFKHDNIISPKKDSNRKKLNPIINISKRDKNSDIYLKIQDKIKETSIERRKIKQRSRKYALDEQVINNLKSGKIREHSMPMKESKLKLIQNGGKKPAWEKLKMSRTEYERKKNTINWKTGKSLLTLDIAKKKTIHVKSYWNDSLKHSRKRRRNRYYIQKPKKRSKVF